MLKIHVVFIELYILVQHHCVVTILVMMILGLNSEQKQFQSPPIIFWLDRWFPATRSGTRLYKNQQNKRQRWFPVRGGPKGACPLRIVFHLQGFKRIWPKNSGSSKKNPVVLNENPGKNSEFYGKLRKNSGFADKRNQENKIAVLQNCR